MADIVLIGMPGAGKSTIGVVLAKRLGCQFVDTDILIQQREKRILQNIIDQDGIERFLDAEERAVLSLSCGDCVVATGGSAVVRESAMLHLRSRGLLVYLKLDLPSLLGRLGNISGRGIALAPGQTLAALYEERIPFYERYADISIDCHGLSFERVLDAVSRSIENRHTLDIPVRPV
jgi:shikimate kinase